MKVFITGGCGKCGTALVALPYDKVFFDRLGRVSELSKEHFVQGDLNDPDVLEEAMQGCDAVVHLAASSSHRSNWGDVLYNNIEGTRSVLKVAHDLGIERVIFASSNRTVEMYELDNAPAIYELDHGVMIDKNVPPRPNSYYGVSKVFGETLGRFLAESGGPKFYALRIGSVRGAQEDHPYAYAEDGVRKGLWERGSEQYKIQEKRLKAIWLSRRDFVQLVELCLQYDGPVFDIFYGVSDNTRRWLDIEYARAILGYQPQDNAEHWTSPPGLVN